MKTVLNYKHQSLLEEIPRGIDVFRTGIEPYMIVSELGCLQADLQAVKNFLIFYACLHDRFNVRSLSNDLVKILSKRYFIRQTF